MGLALAFLGVAMFRHTAAQEVDLEPPVRTDRTTEVVGLIAGGIVPVGDRTTVILGGLYGDSTGSNLSGAFAIANRSLSPDWTLVVGYVGVQIDVDGAPNPNNHNLRLGVTYRHAWERLVLDNRLLYEAVLTDRGREDGNRIRNRLRLTYGLAPERSWKPRVFGYVEPIYDDRFSAVQITNFTVGAGASFGRVDTDLFLTRLSRKSGTGGDTDGITLQAFYKF